MARHMVRQRHKAARRFGSEAGKTRQLNVSKPPRGGWRL